VHGLLDEEVTEILALSEEWGETGRSHRKLATAAPAGSGSGSRPPACGGCCCWSSVRRVLLLADKQFRPRPRPGRSMRKPFPDWAESTPTRSGSRTPHTSPPRAWQYWPSRISSPASGLPGWSAWRRSPPRCSSASPTRWRPRAYSMPSPPARTGPSTPLRTTRPRPILLAVSSNGLQMTSGSTREFMALCAIAQHVSRPVQAHQGRLPTPAHNPRSATLRHKLAVARKHENTAQTARRHRLCHPQRRAPRTRKKPSATPAKPGSNTPANAGLPGTASTGTINTTQDPTMLANRTRSSIAYSGAFAVGGDQLGDVALIKSVARAPRTLRARSRDTQGC
jgi:hypothetical protein